MHHKDRARALVDAHVTGTATEVWNFTNGKDHAVYMVETDYRDYVVRFSRRRPVLPHAWACQQWEEQGAPVPHIHVATEDYVIESRLSGTDMRAAQLEMAEQTDVLKALGSAVKKMHQATARGNGVLDGQGRGAIRQWRDYFPQLSEKVMRRVHRPPHMSQDEVRELRRWLAQHEHYLAIDTPVVLHKDLGASNILVHDTQFVGVIDGSAVIGGDPLYDIGIVCARHPHSLLIHRFLHGYGPVDTDRVLYYAIRHLLWRLDECRADDHQSLRRYIKRIQTVQELLS